MLRRLDNSTRETSSTTLNDEDPDGIATHRVIPPRRDALSIVTTLTSEDGRAAAGHSIFPLWAGVYLRSPPPPRAGATHA
eukprot:1351710-Pyramimonas_sp.AAC.1